MKRVSGGNSASRTSIRRSNRSTWPSLIALWKFPAGSGSASTNRQRTTRFGSGRDRRRVQDRGPRRVPCRSRRSTRRSCHKRRFAWSLRTRPARGGPSFRRHRFSCRSLTFVDSGSLFKGIGGLAGALYTLSEPRESRKEPLESIVAPRQLFSDGAIADVPYLDACRRGPGRRRTLRRDGSRGSLGGAPISRTFDRSPSGSVARARVISDPTAAP